MTKLKKKDHEIDRLTEEKR